MNFDKNLKTLIRQKGITTAELARAIDCPSKTISDWLAGGRTPRDMKAVKRCAEYFNISLHFLLFGVEDKKHLISQIIDKAEIHSGLYEITVRKVTDKSS